MLTDCVWLETVTVFLVHVSCIITVTCLVKTQKTLILSYGLLSRRTVPVIAKSKRSTFDVVQSTSRYGKHPCKNKIVYVFRPRYKHQQTTFVVCVDLCSAPT